MKSKLIAPCGMNCNICIGYLRDKNKCPGCRLNKRKCRIKHCNKLRRFCFNCKKFPCTRLKSLDKRYRTKYGMSMIENLGFIKKKGIRKFIKKEEKRWKCPDGVICVHNKKCYKVK